MTDLKKIAKSIVVHFAHICAYGVETVNRLSWKHCMLSFDIARVDQGAHQGVR